MTPSSSSRASETHGPKGRARYGWRLDSPEAVTKALAHTARAVKRGEMRPAEARAITAALSAMLRAMEVGTIAKQLKRVEESLGAAGVLK